METIRLNLTRKTVDVVLEDSDGRDRNLELRELTGKDRDFYLSGVSERMRYDPKGKPLGLKSFKGLQSSLLTLSLYENDKNVQTKEIEGWPASVQEALFEQAQKISSLNQNEDEEGND